MTPENGRIEEQEDEAEEEDNWDEDDRYKVIEEIDPDDPYQINRVHKIPHETLKELYS